MIVNEVGPVCLDCGHVNPAAELPGAAELKDGEHLYRPCGSCGLPLSFFKARHYISIQRDVPPAYAFAMLDFYSWAYCNQQGASHAR